jgi:hypothetical protein
LETQPLLQSALSQHGEGVIALIPCSAPVTMLEPAPLSALVPTLGGDDRWTGFWGGDDAYYARCDVGALGLTRWYRLGVADGATPRLQSPPRRVMVRRKTPLATAITGGRATQTSMVMVRRPGHPGRCWSVVTVRHR